MTLALESRSAILSAFGADPAVVDEILAYDADGFGAADVDPTVTFPLTDEPFVETWRGYRDEVAAAADFRVLADRLVQLRFPIQQGISLTEEYRAATRRGVPTADLPSATGLVLERPHDCAIVVHPTWAGSIAAVQIGCRTDFVTLVRAFTHRNEPAPVPDSMGACIVAGYNNWDRVRALQRRWNRDHPGAACSLDDIAHLKSDYQDRFLLLSDGWYSGVPPETLGLENGDWRRLSFVIRLEHECAHYWTRRVLSSMRNRVLDEIIADYAGITAACGRFRADWLLAFFGIDGALVRSGGRLWNYRGDPPLSGAAFDVIRRLVAASAANLEAFDNRRPELRGEAGLLLALFTLSTMTLEELASEHAIDALDAALQRSIATTNYAEARG